MKSSVRVKRINGIEYFYEDTPYYDPEKKQIRHRSRYLGKNVDGEPRKIRSRLPHRTYNYGEVLPFLDILEELDIKRHMDLLDETDRNMLIAICINRACRPLPVQHLHYWYMSSYLSVACPVGDFSYKQLEAFLRRIGEGDLDSRFQARLLKGWGTERALLYEISALSDGAESEDRSTCVHSGNEEKKLPGLSVSMIVDPTRGVPFMYDTYPGTADASTFQTTLHRLRAGGVNDCTLVLDHRFFSISNIAELSSAGRSFIVPANRSLKSVRELLSSVRREIDSPEYLHQYGERPLFVKPVVLAVGDREIKGYCYYDLGRERTEQRNFYVQLNDTMEKLRKTKIPGWRDAEDVFKEKTGRMHKFFYLEKEEDGFRIEVRRNAVSQYVNRLGMFILLCQGEADWQECLSMYAEKDNVEQAFRLLRGDTEGSSLNLQKEETVRGLLFASFLGLILRARLSRRMKETGLWKRYTVDSLLLELEGIKKIELEDGSFITTQLTRKQKEIFHRLKMSIRNPCDMSETRSQL